MDSPSHWQHNPVRAKLPHGRETLCSLEITAPNSRTHNRIFPPKYIARSPLSDHRFLHHLAEQTLHSPQVLTYLDTNINRIATTPREGTGGRLALESKRRQTITWHSRPTCTDGTDIRLLWHFSMK